jgi:hypothetical protein
MVLKFSRRTLARAAGACALFAGCTLTGIGVVGAGAAQADTAHDDTAHAAAATGKPGKVGGFAVADGSVSTDGATFDWARDGRTASYRIVIANASTPTAGAAADSGYTLRGTSDTVSTLAAGTAYEAKISAEDAAGASEWSRWVLFYTTAAQGGQGQRGQRGQRGPQGPSGVTSTTTYQLESDPSGAAHSITTGGPFTSHEQLVKAVALRAGTYLLNVNFMATPNEITTGEVFPQFFVYDGTPLASFANDLFNVGSGALAPFNSSTPADQVNSYFSGSNEITVPSGGETLDVYAFGYDGDHGSGAYELNDATLTATALNVARG